MNVVLLVTATLFLVGIFAPMLTTTKFLVFKKRVSLVSALIQLFRNGELLLFSVLFLFCVVFPTAKLVILFRIWNGAVGDHTRRTRDLELLATCGKWSMLDVFVVANFLVIVKLGPIADVEVHAAIYAFAASVALTIYAASKIRELAKAATPSG